LPQVARSACFWESPLQISAMQRVAAAGISRSNWPRVSVAAIRPPRYSFENTMWSRLSAVQSDLMTEMFQAFNESPFGSFRVERIEVVLAQVAVDDRVADEVIGDHD
jgi:hypothetical protein